MRFPRAASYGAGERGQHPIYGRYGMRSADFMDYKIIPAGGAMGEWCLHSHCGDFDIVQRPAIVQTYYDVALSASVTGLARANLWRAMCASKRVIYCDTDSILCESFSGNTGDELGEWKLEAEIDKIWIVGKKCYAMRIKGKTDKVTGEPVYKTAHKGMSKLDVTVQDVMSAAAGNEVLIKKSAPCIKLDGRQLFFSRTMRRT